MAIWELLASMYAPCAPRRRSSAAASDRTFDQRVSCDGFTAALPHPDGLADGLPQRDPAPEQHDDDADEEEFAPISDGDESDGIRLQRRKMNFISQLGSTKINWFCYSIPSFPLSRSLFRY